MQAELIAWSPIIFAVFAVIFLSWVRRGHGGKMGLAIRRSDWHAWKMAVEDREKELLELRRNKWAEESEWRRFVEEKEQELVVLKSVEPKIV